MSADKPTATEKFHAHLDVCLQCYNHPMGLCAVGARLLQQAATGEGHG